VRLHHPEYLQAVFPVGLVARRTQGGGRGGGDQLQIGRRFSRQIDQVFIDDAANAVDRAIDLFDPVEFAGFEDGAGQRLVDDRGGAAALGYQNSGQARPPARLGGIIARLGAPDARAKVGGRPEGVPTARTWKSRLPALGPISQPISPGSRNLTRRARAFCGAR
jgi:hypothetical protein